MVHLKAGQLPTRTLLHGQDAFLLEKWTPRWPTRPTRPGKQSQKTTRKDPPFWMGKPKKRWKDPPCYLAGKIHKTSTGKITMASIANCWHNQRVHHMSTYFNIQVPRKVVWELKLPAQVEKVRLFLHFFTLDFWKFWTSQVPEEQKCTATLW